MKFLIKRLGRNKWIAFFSFLAITTMFNSCTKSDTSADIIVFNANVWTGDENQKTAQSFAIKGDKILDIGSDEAMQQYKASNTKMIDAEGKFITPGFIDSHIHLMRSGEMLLNVQLRDVKSPAEFTQRIADFSKTIDAKTWITGGSWDQTQWGGQMPRKDWIDSVTTEKPVVVMRMDGHMLLANSAALKIAGVDKNTADVAGGEIVRDANGEPTGLLKDNAMNLVLDKIPVWSEDRKVEILQAASKHLLENGVTSVTDMEGLHPSFQSYETADKLRAANQLNIRIYEGGALGDYAKINKADFKNDEWLKVGLVKGFVDGSLGSHTAAFKEDYTDAPGNIGLFINTDEDLYNWISGADKNDIQVTVHAIGDAAIEKLLNIFERVEKENGKKDRRFRMEHVQHIDPKDVNRFAALGVIASMQPYHAADDGRWAETLIGPERTKMTYANKSLFDAKAIVAFGSDWFVATPSVMLGIHAAVNRETLDGKNPNGWVPEQKITLEQSLIAYTKNAAFASFDESIKGTLKKGMLADFVVLSDDLTKIDAKKINQVQVMKTFIGGKEVYSR
jgi:predicted amidohydrolase YtcJ